MPIEVTPMNKNTTNATIATVSIKVVKISASALRMNLVPSYAMFMST